MIYDPGLWKRKTENQCEQSPPRIIIQVQYIPLECIRVQIKEIQTIEGGCWKMSLHRRETTLKKKKKIAVSGNFFSAKNIKGYMFWSWNFCSVLTAK